MEPEENVTTIVDSALSLPLLHRGKVRDVYEAGPDTLLMVASDRVSAFDVVLPQPVPHKGEVLTQLTAWWLDRFSANSPVAGAGGGIDHHLLAVRPEEIIDRVPGLAGSVERWARRAMLVRRTRPILVECVVRGYITGSAWREYRRSGTLAGEPLAAGMIESDRIEPPIFSPSTKALEGHDENITYDQVVEKLGASMAETLRDLSLGIYSAGSETARERGIILADTKFEFGLDASGRLLLIDEVLTPDSSRFWPAEHYQPGRGQPSLDKQPVRDYLAHETTWDKAPPPPDLPDRIVEESTARYLDIFQRLVGVPLADYAGPSFG